nr:SDR family oxidoreductase [Streptomyces sp. Ag109_G2-15]
MAALELAPRGIRTNLIHPGYIETPLMASANPVFVRAHLAMTPHGRAGIPMRALRRSRSTAGTRRTAASRRSPTRWTRCEGQSLSCSSVDLVSVFSQSDTSVSAGGFLSWSYELR